VSPAQCLCAPGYVGDGQLASGCSPCPPNFYCAGGAANLSAACPAHSTAPALSAGASACACDPGYYASGGACALCPANSYCLAGLLLACPANTTSGPGAALQTDCRCVAGFRCAYRRDYQLRLAFQTDLATFVKSEATVRAQVAAAAGVPLASVVLNATAQTGARRRLLEVRAYAPVWRAGEQELILA